eukprot:9467152-Pyramimonas_sp.AAC.2
MRRPLRHVDDPLDKFDVAEPVLLQELEVDVLGLLGQRRRRLGHAARDGRQLQHQLLAALLRPRRKVARDAARAFQRGRAPQERLDFPMVLQCVAVLL